MSKAEAKPKANNTQPVAQPPQANVNTSQAAGNEMDYSKSYAESEFERESQMISTRYQSKVAFLERENDQLRQELGDCREQIKINKSVIKNILSEHKGFNQSI
jgi:hypothetical protein